MDIKNLLFSENFQFSRTKISDFWKKKCQLISFLRAKTTLFPREQVYVHRFSFIKIIMFAISWNRNRKDVKTPRRVNTKEVMKWGVMKRKKPVNTFPSLRSLGLLSARYFSEWLLNLSFCSARYAFVYNYLVSTSLILFAYLEHWRRSRIFSEHVQKLLYPLKVKHVIDINYCK